MHTCNALRIWLMRRMADRSRDMSGYVFQSLLSPSGVDVWVFFASALFGLSVTTVKHIPVWMAGWVHTLSINLRCACMRWHVWTCISIEKCMAGPLLIATDIILCHQYFVCHTTYLSSNEEMPPDFSFQALHPEVNFILILFSQSVFVLQMSALCILLDETGAICKWILWLSLSLNLFNLIDPQEYSQQYLNVNY